MLGLGAGAYLYTQSPEATAEEFYATGLALQSRGNLEGAIAQYDKAIELDATYIEAYSNRGVANMDLGRYDEAVIDFGFALGLNPLLGFLYYNRGLAYERAGLIPLGVVG